ncbi:hypothetical protein AGMMS50262_16020 [Bacteroidia bacterium]|nr:hypothetical protein AGMMS50262_16020 [Bacteroidia bacterium]
MVMLKNPIKEAERYMQNARTVLSEKAEKEGYYYKDKKYVKAAGNYAWNGVLVALGYDGNPDFFIVQQSLKQGQKIIDWAAKNYSKN